MPSNGALTQTVSGPGRRSPLVAVRLTSFRRGKDARVYQHYFTQGAEPVGSSLQKETDRQRETRAREG